MNTEKTKESQKALHKKGQTSGLTPRQEVIFLAAHAAQNPQRLAFSPQRKRKPIPLRKPMVYVLATGTETEYRRLQMVAVYQVGEHYAYLLRSLQEETVFWVYCCGNINLQARVLRGAGAFRSDLSADVYDEGIITAPESFQKNLEKLTEIPTLFGHICR